MANIIGLQTVNSKQILEVDDVPSVLPGTPAPMASIAQFDNGTVGRVFIKFGAADTAWKEFDISEGMDWELFGNPLTGTNATTPDQKFGSTNDFDVIAVRNNIEAWRAVLGGILIGLNASLGGRLQLGSSGQGADILKEVLPAGGVGTSPVIHVTRAYKVLTTDATPATLADIAIPTDSVVHLNAKIAARQTGGSAGTAGDGAAYTREIHARNVGGTVSIRLNQTSFTSEDALLFNVTPSVSTTNVRLQAAGLANRNMAWAAYAELLIVTA
jgi:hypothetical protein